MRRAAVLLVLAALCVAPLASAQERETPEQIATRLGQEVSAVSVDSSGDVGWGRATAVVDASVDDVMRVVTDYASYHEFLPHFTQSRVLSSRGQNALVYIEASVVQDTTTLWANARIFARANQGETRIIEARMVRGNMEKFAARWEVTPVDGGQRCLVRFDLLVEPDLPLPDSVLTDENVKAARRTVRALRQRVRN